MTPSTTKPRLVAIVLTFNSSAQIKETVSALLKLTDVVVAIDSFSSDNTVQILNEHGVRVIQRAFKNYGDQRNFAIKEVGNQYEWQLHVDADEVLSEDLIKSIRQKLDRVNDFDAFFMQRETFFLGKHIKKGGWSGSWHLRLFKAHYGACESALYDQHFVLIKPSRAGTLDGVLMDKDRSSIDEWISKHQRWSALEASQIINSGPPSYESTPPLNMANPIATQRKARKTFYKFPIFLRVLLFFFYRGVVKFGFFGAKEEVIYLILQVFYYRLLVDLRIFSGDLCKEQLFKTSD